MKQLLIWFKVFIGFAVCANVLDLCPNLKEHVLEYSDITDLSIAAQISTQWRAPAKSVFCRHQSALNTLQRSIQSLNDEFWSISINQTIQLASSKDILWNHNVLDQLLCDISDNYELTRRDSNHQLIDLLAVYYFNRSSIVTYYSVFRNELEKIKSLIFYKKMMHTVLTFAGNLPMHCNRVIKKLHFLYDLSDRFKRFKQNSLLWIKTHCKNECCELWYVMYDDFDIVYALVRYDSYEIPIGKTQIKRMVIDLIIAHAFYNTDKNVRRKELCLLKSSEIYDSEYIIQSAFQHDLSARLANKLSEMMVDLMDILHNPNSRDEF